VSQISKREKRGGEKGGGKRRKRSEGEGGGGSEPTLLPAVDLAHPLERILEENKINYCRREGRKGERRRRRDLSLALRVISAIAHVEASTAMIKLSTNRHDHCFHCHHCCNKKKIYENRIRKLNDRKRKTQ